MRERKKDKMKRKELIAIDGECPSLRLNMFI